MEGLLSLRLLPSRYDNILQWSGRRLISYEYSEDFGEGPCGVLSNEYTYNANGIRTSKTVNGIRHDYYLNGTQIIAETWTLSGIEYLLYYLYDETGSPIGMQYRTSNYASQVFDAYFFEKNVQGDIIGVYNSTGIPMMHGENAVCPEPTGIRYWKTRLCSSITPSATVDIITTTKPDITTSRQGIITPSGEGS